jgi:CheY-like chemotaxis protein
MPQGGRLIVETANVEWDQEQCRAHPDRLPGRYAAVSITDAGIGMSSDVQQRIFDPFFTTKEPGKGTGLGLSVVQGIVTQSDGFLEVRSQVNQGTTFLAYFPAVRGPVEYSSARQTEPRPMSGCETVMLVEDQVEVRKLLRRTLESHGHTVLEAVDGQEALALAAAHAGPIDLVVTDMVMPGMSGRAMVEQLRSQLPELKVLFISGYTDDSVVRHATVDATPGFLQKPFAPIALVRKVRELLEDSKSVGRHLLFIDDEGPLVFLATRVLQEHGYRVSGCSTAADALAAFNRDPMSFDIVITDLKMRDMSGLDLAKQLHALRPDLPVIIATGYVDDEIEMKAAAAGVAAVLAKPGTVEALGVLIHRAVRKLSGAA